MLSRLELRGFKSFAGTVTLDFGPGINVIVGPNGSGKSNLSEAVSWALGEQRAGRLRAPSMAEVIFAGGAARPPAGLAEVTLALGAADGGVEIEATRRLTRAGDSDYRLNGTGCRLVDLQERLSSYGLGPDGLAVIRQGQVEALSTSRPEDRRAMIEEAAGVGVSKRRRHRAGLKLTRVAEKLDRAQDIAREVGSRGRALDRQAAAATRAAQVDAELLAAREVRRRAIAAEAHRLAGEARALRDAASTGRQAAETARDEARRAVEEAERARGAAAGAAAAADERALVLRGAAERVTARAESVRERIDGALDHASRAMREHGEAVEEEARLAPEEATLGEALRAAEAELIGHRAALQEAEEGVARLGRALQEMEEAAVLARQREARRVSAFEEAQADLARLTAALDAARGRRERMSAEDGARDLGARADRRAEIARGRVERWTAAGDAARAAVDEAGAGLAAAEAARRNAAEEVARYGRVAEQSGAARLGDGVRVEAGAERAVAAALGALADAALASDVSGAAELLEGGEDVAIVPAPARRPGTPPAGARAVIELVSAEDPARRAHLERLLADAWLVDDLTDVASGAEGCFVTRDGRALRPADGVVSGSRSEWAVRALAERAQEVLRAAEEGLAPARAALDAARAAAGRVDRRIRAAERCGARANGVVAAVRQEAAHLAAQRQAVEAEIADAEAGAAAAQERLAAAATLARDESVDHRGAIDATQAELTAARAERERLQAAVTAAGREAAERAARAGELGARLAALRGRIAAVPRGAPDVAPLRRIAAALAAVGDHLAVVARGAVAERDARRVEAAEADRAVAGVRAALDERDTVLASAAEAVHAREVELAVAEERARDAGPAPAGDDLPEEDAATLAERVEALERRRAALGVVNPLAAEERAELAEREAEIAAQIDDLTRASEELRAHMREMDEAVSGGFDGTFDAVSKRFGEVVELLFPGGRGHLSLVEPTEEEGERGVEIEVVPAGKRPRPMSLLSGGERTLVALAFLLSIAMSRPAPVYVLDEVEAALDDINLRRFLGVVRRLAEETQFVLITHQQPTVEVADTLFGVTMGQDGVSQILARRLARSVEGPAKPYVRRMLRALPGGAA